MKQYLLKNSFLRGVLFLLLCAIGLGNAWGEKVTVTFDASKQGYTNAQVIKNVTITDGITIKFDKGTNSNSCKYYNTGTAIRVYGGGYFTISSTIGNITKIVFTFSSGEDSNEISKNCGTYYSSNGIWEGTSELITFTIGGTKGHRRIKTIAVTYQTSTTPDAPTPELESINFEAADNIEYYVGETVTENGLTITANYTNGTNADVTKDVENWTFTPGTINSINDNSISVEFDYAGKAYNTYSFNITVKSIANTAESAYTVAQACAIIDADKGLSEEVYVKGIVSQVDEFYEDYGSITYWISEDGTTTGQQFQCYGGLDIDGEKFTSIDDLKLGTAVIVKGHLIKYNNTTYELYTNNVLISKDESNVKTLSSIEIGGTPSKTSYYIGDTPSAEGLTVYAVYSDSSKVDVTDDVTWTFNPETIAEGTKQVTATAIYYKELTATYKFRITKQDFPPIYELIPIEGKDNAYAGTESITINGVTWSVTGNSTMVPWRIGGKYLTEVDRDIKCSTPINGTFGKVVVSIGKSSSNSSITFNSLTLFVADNPGFTNATKYKHTSNLKANTEHTFDITPVTNAYYKITYNVTVPGKNNQYYEFSGAKFYRTDNVEISSAGLATFCLPYNATIPDGLTAYTATDNGESVTLTAIENGKIAIAAGEGVVLHGEEGTYTFVATAEDVSATAGNQMVGVTEKTELTSDDNAYMLTRKIDDGSIAFRLLKTNYTLGANKAYLKASNTANIRELIPALWDDNATDIDNIAKDEVTATGAIYNLAGQKLMRAQKGINIINGKLVIK